MAIDSTLAARLARFKTAPTEADAIRLCEELLLEDRATEALEIIQTVQMVVPERSRLWVLEGMAKSKLGDLIGAQAAWIRAAKHFRSDRTVFGGLVDVLLRRGDTARAAKVYERLLQLAPNDQETLRLGRRLKGGHLPEQPNHISTPHPQVIGRQSDMIPAWLHPLQEGRSVLSWVPAKVLKRSGGTSTWTWFGVAWLITLGSIGTGVWKGYPKIERPHPRAEQLRREALNAIIAGDYQNRLLAERKLRQALDLDHPNRQVQSALILLQAQRSMEDGRLETALLRKLNGQFSKENSGSRINILAKAILSIVDNKPKEAQQLAESLSQVAASSDRIEPWIDYLAMRVLQHTQAPTIQAPKARLQHMVQPWLVAIENAYLSGDNPRALGWAERARHAFPTHWQTLAWQLFLQQQKIPRISTERLSPRERAWLGVIWGDDSLIFEAAITDPQAQRLLARMLIAQRRFGVARTFASRAVMTQPWVDIGREILAESSVAMGDGAGALDALAPLRTLTPGAVQLRAQSALLLRATDALRRSDIELMRISGQPDKSLDILALRARVAIALHRLNDAAPWVFQLREHARRARPSHNALHAISDYYLARAWNNPVEYAWHTRVLQQMEPSLMSPDAALKKRIALASLRSGDDIQAIAHLQAWLQNHPNDSEALFWLASLLQNIHRCPEALSLFRRLTTRAESVWIDSQAPISLSAARLGYLGLERCGSIPPAISAHMANASVFENIWQTITQAQIELQRGKKNDAEKIMNATRQDASHKVLMQTPVLVRDACKTWIALEQWKDAKDICERWTTLQPTHALAWDAMGRVFSGLKRPHDAKYAWDKAKKASMEAQR